MRITKTMLEEENEQLRKNKLELLQEIAILSLKVKWLTSMFDTYLRGTTSLTVALEKTTDAVAHITTGVLNKIRRFE